jgi:hypothetical protein
MSERLLWPFAEVQLLAWLRAELSVVSRMQIEAAESPVALAKQGAKFLAAGD